MRVCERLSLFLEILQWRFNKRRHPSKILSCTFKKTMLRGENCKISAQFHIIRVSQVTWNGFEDSASVKPISKPLYTTLLSINEIHYEFISYRQNITSRSQRRRTIFWADVARQIAIEWKVISCTALVIIQECAGQPSSPKQQCTGMASRVRGINKKWLKKPVVNNL